MNTVSIDNVNPGVELVSIDDMATFLNLFFQDLVELFLEYLTIFTDDELIQEIINTLNLNITCVVDNNTPVGYITPRSVKA